ncbi:S9 family peptidase [Streptomyces sp. NPDC004284]|uniref:S9 family peptidase n=1 Tax=Streptomyces sp. NPDC004284 TaxID=3364695 RepID=UPI0036ABC797
MRTEHVADEFAWLADRNAPEVLAHLTAENRRYERATGRLGALRDTVVAEIAAASGASDLSVPVRKGGHWYYSRTTAAASHRIHCRIPVSGDGTEPAPDVLGARAGEEVVLDENLLAGESGHVVLGGFEISPDGARLAYAADHVGDERYVLRVKDVASGAAADWEIAGTSGDIAWSGDAGRLFYVALDETGRPHQVRRRQVAPGAPDVVDELVHEESDPRFWLSLGLTRSGAYVLIESHSKTTSEIRCLPADRPDGVPRPVGSGRADGVEVSVEHQGDRFLVLHNDGAENFVLDSVAVADTAGTTRRRLVEHRDDTRLLSVDAFAEHVVVRFRRDGLGGLMVLPDTGPAWEVVFPEPLYALLPEANPEYRSRTFRLRHTSLATPDTVYACDLETGALAPLKRRLVHGGFRPEAYVQHRVWATAADGTGVPVSLVARADVPRDGTAPLLLVGYGSYETCVDPWFSVSRLSLLDRGFVFAIAHVRGGGELGRRWYEQGRRDRKANSFGDFVACAEHLAAEGWTRRGRIVARGGSAGGLLVGAALNLAPDLFAGIVAEVPFVDPLHSMLDPDHPLTAVEREEWGDPIADPQAYACIRAYAPYDNVRDTVYPPVLATAGLHDPRVAFHGPAKWIARLRATARGGPFLLRTALGGGHTGPSGRQEAWRQEAETLAWVIDTAGAHERHDKDRTVKGTAQ